MKDQIHSQEKPDSPRGGVQYPLPSRWKLGLFYTPVIIGFLSLLWWLFNWLWPSPILIVPLIILGVLGLMLRNFLRRDELFFEHFFLCLVTENIDFLPRKIRRLHKSDSSPAQYHALLIILSFFVGIVQIAIWVFGAFVVGIMAFLGVSVGVSWLLLVWLVMSIAALGSIWRGE